MRVFVGLTLPDSARSHLESFLEPRRDAAEGLRFTGPDTWHVTLAFMGQCPDRVVDDLISACGEVAARHPAPTLRLAGANAFPEIGRARLLYAAVTADPDCAPLARSIRTAAQRIGAAPDGGAFVPHVTLARQNRGRDMTAWWRILDTYDGPPWQPDGVSVIQSHLQPGSPAHYEGLAVLPWSPQPS